MSTTTIIAELLVIGLLALTTILFCILSIFKIGNFIFLMQMKDFASIMAILLTILAYLFGALQGLVRDTCKTVPRTLESLTE